ncbi:MAG: phosphoribosyl-ATP diphosphatase [Eggerthellaceae bacterium]|jgi:phosphoribosyl-ATP pyrophosphohydrolase/phosphoribosyl-ATP pyrophosphohydrolase/phosphoribosyl-AMP cyclohydrolase|nr:phosphoribosyl-ATP diphosphatase [Eggerthellaceae bacterium]
MSYKTYIPKTQNENEPLNEGNVSSQIAATLEALAKTIEARRSAGEESYTYRLLESDLQLVLDKITEEALEVVEAAHEADADHLRYEIADLVYHLLVVLGRFDISLDELSAELNMRMTDEERPLGGICLHEQYVKRGK